MNFNFPLLDLNDKPILQEGVPAIAGKVLAQQLYVSSIADPIKWNDIARKMYAGEEIELDKSDKEKLKQFVLNSQAMINGVKEQIFIVII